MEEKSLHFFYAATKMEFMKTKETRSSNGAKFKGPPRWHLNDFEEQASRNGNNLNGPTLIFFSGQDNSPFPVLKIMNIFCSRSPQKDTRSSSQIGKIDRSEFSTAYTLTVPNESWTSVRNQEETPYYLKHLTEKRFYFEYFEDKKVVYVRQSSVFDDENETAGKLPVNES